MAFLSFKSVYVHLSQCLRVGRSSSEKHLIGTWIAPPTAHTYEASFYHLNLTTMGRKLFVALKFLIRVLELLIAVTKEPADEKRKEAVKPEK